MNKLSGIIHYKLRSKYAGDTTKFCGLTGPEIDYNFHFLRGNDIETADFDGESGILTLTKVNGEKLTVEIKPKQKKCSCGENCSGYTDCNCGCDVTASYTDNTIDGDGTKHNPLSISRLYKTGFYSPAIKFLNLVSGDTLPDNPEIGDRYVTMEGCSDFGLLYNKNALEVINRYLVCNSSKWRIPTSMDWGELLNAVEPCDEYREHVTNECGVELGYLAGGILKNRKYNWETDSLKNQKLSNTYAFKILSTGIKENDELHGFGNITEFWTSDKQSDGSYLTKRFVDECNTVLHTCKKDGTFLSIRLVRDLDNDFSVTEKILGNRYNCIKMPSIDEDGNITYKSWIKTNLFFPSLLNSDLEDVSALAIKVVDNDGEFVDEQNKLYITEWDGREWIREESRNNSLIILEEGLNGEVGEEWVIKKNELIRRYDALFNDITDELFEYIDNNITDVNDYITEILENIQELIKAFSDGTKDYLDEKLESINVKINSLLQGVNTNDKILSIDENNILSSTLKLGIVGKQLQLLGINNAIVDRINIDEKIGDIFSKDDKLFVKWMVDGTMIELPLDNLNKDIKYLNNNSVYELNANNEFGTTIKYTDGSDAFNIRINNNFGEITI